MSREPEAIMEQRRQLGAALATFRQAAELSQAQVGMKTVLQVHRWAGGVGEVGLATAMAVPVWVSIVVYRGARRLAHSS